MRRHLLILGATVAVVIGTVAPVQIARATVVDNDGRPFAAPAYSVNTAGDLLVIGNTQMTCPPSAGTTCTEAQAGRGTKVNNNDFAMAWVDADDDPATTNSSKADLQLPTGAEVLFAGLYWGGMRPLPVSTAAPQTQVKFKAPGATGYTTLTADRFDVAAPSGRDFSAFVDVTATVSAAGPGTYAVADIVSTTGLNGYGGWSLVVAYSDSSQPVRNITIYDAFESVAPGNPATINLTGFRTPATGPVNTKLGFVAFEGDRGASGDQLKLAGRALANPARPSNNFYNSTITTPSGDFTAKEPNYVNNFSVDTGIVDASGILANGATTATLQSTTVGDYYKIAVLAFATELTAPRYSASLAVNQSVVNSGTLVEFTMGITNNGADASATTSATITLPAGFTFAAGSSAIDGVGVADAGGRLVIAGQTLTFHLGTGADNVTGGALAIGASTRVTFSATAAAVADTNLRTAFTVNGAAAVSNLAVTGRSNEVGVRVDATSADLAVSIRGVDQLPAVDGTAFAAGSTGRFVVDLRNNGPRNLTAVTVAAELPPGVTYVSATGSGWTGCSYTAPVVECSRAALGFGQTADPVTIVVAVPANAAVSTVTALATTSVTTPGLVDPDLTNNTDLAAVQLVRSADLSIDVTRSGDTVQGQTLNYRLDVRNTGPSDAGPAVGDAVTVSATLPNNVNFVSAVGDGWACAFAAPEVTCTRAVLAAGALAPSITIATTVNAAGIAELRAAVESTATDPDPADNIVWDTTETIYEVALIESIFNTNATADAVFPVTVNVKNAGPSIVPSGTVITHTIDIPDGATLAAIVTANGWVCDPATAGGPSTSACTRTLAADWIPGTELADLVLGVTIAALTEELLIRATVTTDSPAVQLDPELATATDNLVSAALSDLAVSGTTPTVVTSGGGAETLVVDVTNLGPDIDPGPVTVHLEFPDGITATVVPGSPWSCSGAGDELDCSWSSPDLFPANQFAPDLALSIAASRPSGIVQIVAVVGSPKSDPEPANDSARLTVVVRDAGGGFVPIGPIGPPAGPALPTPQRIGGADRFATAVAVSQAFFGDGAPVVYLATGADFADALVAGPPAGLEPGPVLLTERDRLPADTLGEIRRLGPRRIVIAGGPNAVSTGIEQQLRAAGYEVTRIGGADRYETAVLLGRTWKPGTGGTVFVATGTGFADALSAGPPGGATGAPILLTTATSIPAVTAAELQRRRPDRIVIIGGPGVVSSAVETALRAFSDDVTRIAGTDRYRTSSAVSAGLFSTPVPLAILATGIDFPDALSAVPPATAGRGPVLLVRSDCVPAPILDELERLRPQRIVAIGQAAALSEAVISLRRC